MHINAPPLFAWPAAVAVFVSCLLLPLSIDASSGRSDWQILSAHNFSSQIHLHPHVLLLVTVPWCGESRSLMKELSHQLSNKQDKLASINPMVVFSNQDQVLSESFGAAEGITIIFYQYGIPYKYIGRLSAQEIISSASYLMSLMPDGLPLTTIDTPDDMEKFLASTDKAVLLLDSCGWTPRLLAQHNGNETATGISGDDSARLFNMEAKQTILSGWQKNVEALRSEKLKCDIDYEYGGIPWVREFSSYNERYTSTETDEKLSAGSSCSLGDYQKFASFFSKFIVIARDMFLPPQRQRYGLLSNSSLLSSLGVEGLDVWSLIVYYAGCPNCTKVLKDESKLQVALEMHSSLVMELVNAGEDTGPAFPIHEPSVVLFVDRSAHSVEVRRRSKEALSAFKEASLQYQNSLQMNAESIDWLKKPQVQTYRESTTISGDPRIVSSPLSQKIKLKDKMSVVIVKDETHATLENTGSTLLGHSLHEILTQLLEQKKQAKLSLLAKEVGFHLLSDDIDISITDGSISHTESHSVSASASAKPSLEHPIESADETKNYPNSHSSSFANHEKQYDLSVDKLPNNLHVEAIQDLIDTQSSYVSSQQFTEGEPSVSTDAYPEEPTYLHTNQVLKQLHQSEGFAGSFFFSDGNYQLLRSLTSESKVPRMVIIDPVSQMHYVSPQSKDFSYLSVTGFINRVFNGSLPPHQRSASLQKPLEASLHPPFVNLDFHEKDSIPSLTTNRFTELVLGSSTLAAQNSSNAWNKDVLVLFSNSWCGFCQRMDLVVREVYRSLKGYMDLDIGRTKNKKVVISNDSLKAVMLKLPRIYRIDCTWNDCTWILKSVNQREFYPSLMLFRGKRKTALLYDGDMTVNNIINFIVKHSSSSFHMVRQKSDEKEYRNVVKDVSPTANHHESSEAHEVLLSDHIQRKQVRYIQKAVPIDAKAPQYSIVPGSFLVATDKLADVNTFSKARILIVSADQHSGFQGLILNKPINQESRTELGLPELLKEAMVSFGGPVVDPTLPFTALIKKPIEGQHLEVLRGVYFLNQSVTLSEIEKLNLGKGDLTDYRFFLGYSGWGWHQLFDEISEGAWSLDDSNDEHSEWL